MHKHVKEFKAFFPNGRKIPPQISKLFYFYQNFLQTIPLEKSYGIQGKIFSGYLTKIKHTRDYADNKYHDEADEAVCDENFW